MSIETSMDTRITGRIVKGVGGNYHVSTKNGLYICQARGLFRKEGISPLVGDYVEIDIVDNEKKAGYLQKIMPRTNSLIRPKIANIDQVVLVSAVVPPINLEVVDGFLVYCQEQGVDVVFCINKVDLDEAKDYRAIVQAYARARYKVLCVSAKGGHGLNELGIAMQGKTSIFAGPSGVGKSSLLNALYPQCSLDVGGLSDKIQRGKHTTRHTLLLAVAEDTFVIDSPGFTSFSIAHIDKSRLAQCYPEFTPYLQGCYYIDCMHVHEHDCAIKEQVGKTIDPGRYERYTKFVKKAEA